MKSDFQVTFSKPSHEPKEKITYDTFQTSENHDQRLVPHGSEGAVAQS